MRCSQARASEPKADAAAGAEAVPARATTGPSAAETASSAAAHLRRLGTDPVNTDTQRPGATVAALRTAPPGAASAEVALYC